MTNSRISLQRFRGYVPMSGMPRRSPLQHIARASNVRALPYAFVAVALVYAGILLGTGLTSLRHDRALISELRRHGATATAAVGSRVPERLTGAWISGSPGTSFGFHLPDGRVALTADLQFDGAPSASPPAGGGLRYLVVRYDPANVAVVLPEAVVAHPSYARLMALTAEGAGIAAAALALGAWWWWRERRRRSRHTALICAALQSAHQGPGPRPLPMTERGENRRAPGDTAPSS
jgi:hypothetical protein